MTTEMTPRLMLAGLIDKGMATPNVTETHERYIRPIYESNTLVGCEACALLLGLIGKVGVVTAVEKWEQFCEDRHPHSRTNSSAMKFLAGELKISKELATAVDRGHNILRISAKYIADDLRRNDAQAGA